MNVFQCNVFQQNVFQNNCGPVTGGGGRRGPTAAQLRQMLIDNAQAQKALQDEEALLLMLEDDS